MKHAQPACGNTIDQPADKAELRTSKLVTDLFLGWQLEESRINASKMSEEELSAANARLNEIERSLMATACCDAGEWIMKALVASRYGWGALPTRESNPSLWSEGKMFAFAPDAVAADPVLDIYRAWLLARDQVHRIEDLYGAHDHPAVLAADKIEMRYFDWLVSTPPISREGVAALMHVLWTIDGPMYRPDTKEYAAEVESPAAKLMAAIWRYGAGRDGLPRVE